jgi:hypothetical protein
VVSFPNEVSASFTTHGCKGRHAKYWLLDSAEGLRLFIGVERQKPAATGHVILCRLHLVTELDEYGHSSLPLLAIQCHRLALDIKQKLIKMLFETVTDTYLRARSPPDT